MGITATADSKDITDLRFAQMVLGTNDLEVAARYHWNNAFRLAIRFLSESNDLPKQFVLHVDTEVLRENINAKFRVTVEVVES